MLSHTEFVRKHWTDNGKGLRKRHQMFLCGVRVAGINCLNSNDGFFCWVDLRHLLQSRNQEGAIRLWKIILEEFGSNVSPGSSWHCSDPGWFSFCFSYMSDQTVQESLNQIQLFMERRRSNPIYDKERACQKMTAKKKERKRREQKIQFHLKRPTLRWDWCLVEVDDVHSSGCLRVEEETRSDVRVYWFNRIKCTTGQGMLTTLRVKCFPRFECPLMS